MRPKLAAGVAELKYIAFANNLMLWWMANCVFPEPERQAIWSSHLFWLHMLIFKWDTPIHFIPNIKCNLCWVCQFQSHDLPCVRSRLWVLLIQILCHQTCVSAKVSVHIQWKSIVFQLFECKQINEFSLLFSAKKKI